MVGAMNGVLWTRCTHVPSARRAYGRLRAAVGGPQSRIDRRPRVLNGDGVQQTSARPAGSRISSSRMASSGAASPEADLPPWPRNLIVVSREARR